MAVDLADLVPRLKASLTAPGSPSPFVFTDGAIDEWILALENAFWQARLGGMFTQFRVEDGEVLPLVTGDDDLSEELHQVIVVYAAMTALEARLMAMADTRYQAGPMEVETRRSATLLNALLARRREDLVKIRDELTETAPGTSVAFIDLVIARHDQIAQGSGYWVN